MAKRLTENEWTNLKAEWVTGAYTDQQLSDKYGNSKQAISKKARNEGWVKANPEDIIELVENRKVVKSSQKVVKDISTTLGVSESSIDGAIDRLATLKAKLEDNALSIAVKVPEMIDMAAEPKELKDLADTNSKIYDTHFKQSAPQVAIQNNNTANAGVKTFSELYGNTES